MPSLSISIISELKKETPFLAAIVEARPAPLPIMASGRDRGERS
jgi:hypothetical protein